MLRKYPINRMLIPGLLTIGGPTLFQFGVDPLIALATGATGLMWLATIVEKFQTQSAIERALPMLNGIYEGLLYVGRECVAIQTQRIDDPAVSGPYIFEQLCKTNTGRWFKLRFSTRSFSTTPMHFHVRICNEREAKRLLGGNSELYRQYFGEPDIA